MNQTDQVWLENRVSAAISDDFYLDRDEEKRIKEESSAKGMLINDIELVIRLELDKYGAVSERILLIELDKLLHQFTDDDKELDSKEERDTLNKVSRPAPGKKMGLDPRIAEEYVSSFCKVNGVRRNTDVKKWGIPVTVVATLTIGAIVAFGGINLLTKPQVETVTKTVIETKVVEANKIILNDQDKVEIDDQLRRAEQFIEKAQYTDPPEKSAKASLDQIKQIDPNGQYRGDEVKNLYSKIVEHYVGLAEKSVQVGDKSNAIKWLDRAKLMNTDREVIVEKEKELGLISTTEQ